MKAPLPECLQHFQQGVGMHERLAATKRDAAARLLHHQPLLLHRPQNVFQRPILAGLLQRQRGASLHPLRLVGAAMDALGGRKETRGLVADAFGVVTPHAVERATLHEERRAYAGPVVDGEALDVKKPHSRCVR